MANHEQLAARGKEIIQAAPQLYVDVDVEADGIPGYGSLLSVGAVSPWGETYYSELRPSSTRYIESNRAFCEAHNASFDFPWVDLAMKEAEQKNPFGIAGYCIKSLAHNLSKDYDWRQTAKGRLPAEIVPKGDFTHNALEDAIYQQKIHNALVGVLECYKGHEE